ncbi:phospholipid-transporting ATPase ABCA3-like isoform X4 [Dermacentor albipictus]|uniref:phospholipid-transporting ATPase ABCA3-like isoform X4 n=1 Tax=Dermacentor albipictus TaxID=60249 RepID=UPI0031FDD061
MFWAGAAAVASRSLFMQRLWRHWPITSLEIVFVTLCFFTMLDADAPEPRSLPDLRRMESTSVALGHALVPGVVYVPRTDYTEELVRRAFASIDDPYVKLRKNAPERGRRQSKEMRTTNKSGEKSKAAIHPDNFYAAKWDKGAVLEACKAASAQGSQRPCVLFNEWPGEGARLAYSLLLFVPDIAFVPETFRLGRSPLMRQMFLDKKAIDAAFQFQQALDTAHINLQRNMTTDVPLYHVFARQIPDPVPISDGTRYRNMFYVILTLAFAAPFVRLIHEISSELATGLKENQIAAGVTLGAFWTGHFASALTVVLVESVCAVCVMVKVKTGATQSPYLDPSDAGLLLGAFVAFSVSHTLLAFVVAAAVPRALWSETIGFLVFAILPAWEGLDFLFDSLGSYLRTGRLSKLRLCFYPNLGITMAVRIIAVFRDFGGTRDWNIVGKKALNLDNVTLLEIWLAMLAANVVMIFLIWYLPHVLPWANACPEHPLFFISPRYWTSLRILSVAENNADKPHAVRFEPEPSHLQRILRAKGITQKIHGKIVLNAVDLTFYAPQVTVVAGPSGAGKTVLLKILAGLLRPTRGRVEISHLDSSEDGDWNVRSAMCPQNNVLFSDLTVWEHLAYFALMQGGSLVSIRERIQDCLVSMDLLDKSASFPAALTPGLKRRLCVAIALVTEAHILFLDEPMTGLDTDTRRNIWNVIASASRRLTVVLSSHEMTEADCLADRIILLSHGEVICDGSPAYLKNACKAGFKLRIGVNPSQFPFERLLKAVRHWAPGSFAEHSEGDEMTISLETRQNQDMLAVIKALEAKAYELQIKSVAVSVATMKDLYVRIAERWMPDNKYSYLPSDGDVKAACTPVIKRPHGVIRFYALLTKRFFWLSRSYFVIVAGWFLPVFIFSFAIYVTSTKLFTARGQMRSKSIDLRFSEQFPEANVFLQANSSDLTKHFLSLLRQQGATVIPMKNAYLKLRTMAEEHYDQYSTTIAFGGVFSGSEIELWYSPYTPVSKAVGLNLITTALNQVYSGDNSGHIVTTLSVYNKSRSHESWPSAFVPELARNWIFWSLLPVVAFGFLTAVFVLQPSSEKLSGVKALLSLSGTPPPLDLFANLVFDLLFYVVPMGTCFGLYAWFFRPNKFTAEVLALIVACFAPAAILCSYSIAELSNTLQSTYAVCVGLFVVGAPAVCVWYALRTAFLRRGVPRAAFSCFPPFAMTSSVVRAVNLPVEAEACVALRATRAGARTALHSACPNVSSLGPGFQHCCEMIADNLPDQWDILSPLSLSANSVLVDLGILLLEAIILFTVLCTCPPRMGRSLIRRKISDVGEGHVTDEGVTAEKLAVERACAEGGNMAEYALVVNGVSRFFGDAEAVKNASLAVRPGECLGLLGVNGSGKTTLLNVMAGIVPPSRGECYSKEGSTLGGAQKWQSDIGLCLQSGGIPESMSARSFLRLLGRLRGVSEWQVGEAAESLLTLFDMKKPRDEPCYTYVMDDCELACDRVAVLSKGEITSVGTVPELKAKLAKGHTIQFVLHRVSGADAEVFKNCIDVVFPDLKLRDVCQNTLEYSAAQKIPWVKWFEKIVVFEKMFDLEHVYISATEQTQFIVVVAKKIETSHVTQDLGKETAMT